MSKRIASRRRAFSQVISSSLSSSRTSSSYFLIVWIVSACLITRSIGITHLHICVFNYGDVDIEIKAQIGDVTSENWIDVALGEMMPINAIELTAITGEILDITTYTGRGNNAYYRYFVS